MFHFRNMSPKVDQTSSAEFSTCDPKNAASHALSTPYICDTSIMSVSDSAKVLPIVTCNMTKMYVSLSVPLSGVYPIWRVKKNASE